jgi:uroporphyrinogen decarboxylase
MRTIRQEPTERPPIWIMRQAGRYMPEYRAVRQELTFLELCKDPRRAAEVTMLPMDMLGVDAAIVFSDILIPVEAMGMRLIFGDGGPSLPEPIRSGADVAKLKVAEPARDCPWPAETIDRLLPQLGSLPCLGFSGAPFTLASYMVEGRTSRSFNTLKAMMYREPELLRSLLDLVTETVVLYLRSQIDAGAAAVQLFDTWAGALSPDDYDRWCLPYHQRVFSQLDRDVPTLLYVNGGGTVLDSMRRSGATVVSLDWRVRIGDARKVLGPGVPVQGNMEPAALYGPPEVAAELARKIIADGGTRGHIFNLGHGITPDVPVSHAQALVRAVQSARY